MDGLHAPSSDLRHYCRVLLKDPIFTATVVLTLTLGIGANAALFSVVNAVLLRGLPYPDSKNLVQVLGTDIHGVNSTQGFLSYQNFLDLRRQNQVFESIAAYRPAAFSVTSEGKAEFIPGAVVSGNLFTVLKQDADMGRTIVPEDDKVGATPVALIGERLWRNKLGSRPDIIGSAIRVDGQPFTVVGVMPDAFRFPPEEASTQMWLPVTQDPNLKYLLPLRGAANLLVLARMKASIQISQAQVGVSTIAGRLASEFPATDARLALKVIPLKEQVVGKVKATLILLLIAVGLVLLIACVNVASMMLARAVKRRQEIAMRIALGGSRGRILRQVLVESVFLGLLGGSVGVAFAYVLLRGLLPLAPANFYAFHEVKVDGTMLLFTATISLIAGVIFGAIPALQLSKLDISSTLKEGGRSAEGGLHSSNLRGALASAEIAIATVLLIGSGLLLQSFLQVQRVDLGFDTLGVVTGLVSLPKSQYTNSRRWAIFYENVMQRLKASPSIQYVGAVLPLPLTGSAIRVGFSIQGHAPRSLEERTVANYAAVSGSYFRAMGIPLLEGRFFSPADSDANQPVTIINRAFAREFFINENPIGKRLIFSVGVGPAVSREIVGVVGDVRRVNLVTVAAPELFTPASQTPWWVMTFVIRSSNIHLAAQALRLAVQSEDKNLPIANLIPMQGIVNQFMATPRMRLSLIGSFAVLALALAAIGIYGVLSYSVNRRTREIGIRIALGAQQRNIFGLILRNGLKIVLLGLAVGLVCSFALARLLSSMLFGVRPMDPGTYCLVSVLLVVVSLVACYVPAQRALKVDPAICLRYE